MHSPTPYALRPHIGIFGRTNVGKSSLLNQLTKQSVSIVADEHGVTGDPVYHAFELIPVGPVVFVDTPGLGGQGELAFKRQQASLDVLVNCDIALLVTNQQVPQDEELYLLKLLEENNIPCVVVLNQSDCVLYTQPNQKVYSKASATVIVSSKTGEGIDKLFLHLKNLVRACQENEPGLLDGLVQTNDLVMLVAPIDQQAPKGRLILPQVMVIRQLLDLHAKTIVVALEQMLAMLDSLKEMPKLVICDSQIVKAVDQKLPKSIKLTTFSVILSRFKGDLIQFARAAAALSNITPQSNVIIAEACSHYALDNDIGRVKIPTLLANKVGAPIQTTICTGRKSFTDIAHADIVVHCGGCMITRRQMLVRQQRAIQRQVMMTNYGMAIAFLHGIVERVLSPFPEALIAYKKEQQKISMFKQSAGYKK